jgi:hypothetical protein
MNSNIAVGIIRNIGGGGSNAYLSLGLSDKGTNNCVPNTGPGLETGDIVRGWKDANTYWIAAIYNGGDPADRSNYTPLQEQIMDFVCPVPTIPIPSGGSGTPPSGGGSTTLPLLNFHYEGLWETGDSIHHPEINSWVDYLDEHGVQYRFIIGGIELGCQLIVASSIVAFHGCSPCMIAVTYVVDNQNLFAITINWTDWDGIDHSELQQEGIVEYQAIQGTLITQNDGVSINIV